MKNPSRRSFLKGAAGTLALTLAAGGAHGQTLVVINENGTVTTNAATPIGAATFIAPKSCVASSLETGDVIYVTAWGGHEYGYAYHYALSRQPAGVTIDIDTGIITIGTRLAVGSYAFTIIVTNRENTSLSASFPFTLNVLQGITSGTPTTSQIRHATFDPHSGTWGAPTGGNWTNVFNTMKAAIIALQIKCNAVHDESLRVFIPLHRGVIYQYTNNAWLDGIQYYQIYATGSGALPVLQNIRSDPTRSNPYIDGPLQTGGQCGSINHQEGIKTRCATIATVAAGSTTVTLRNAADATKIKLNRWHQVMGKALQVGGFPPNQEFIDYVKVTGVSGTTVTLDRPLKYGYNQTWWENPKDDQSLGVGRLAPFDTGGAGGYIPTDPRCVIRAYFLNLNFLGNPNFPGGPNTNGANIWNVGAGIHYIVENCRIPNAQFGMSKHFVMRGVTQTWQWEPDKLSETLLIDRGVNNGQVIGGTTGWAYLLIRNSHVGTLNVSPRQLRSKGSWHDGTGDGNFPGQPGASYGSPVGLSYNGSNGFWDFGMDGACQFSKGNDNHWMYPNPSGDESLTIGSNATWSGSQLRIPRSFAKFEPWLIYTTAGAILSTNPVPPYTANWGYISDCTSPGDGSALWLNVVWVNGTKPTSGTLWLRRLRRLYFAQANTLNPGTIWASPGAIKETAPGREAGWSFPTALPGQYET